MKAREDNERICEWLGWKRSKDHPGRWIDADRLPQPTLNFDCWDSAGYLMDTIQRLPKSEAAHRTRRKLIERLRRGTLGPLSIRTVILEHIAGR